MTQNKVDLKEKKPLYLIRFWFDNIKQFTNNRVRLYVINTETGEEEEAPSLGNRFWGSMTFGLSDNSRSWVSVKIRDSRVEFWVKRANSETKIDRHFQVIQGKIPQGQEQEYKVAITENDEMIKDEGGRHWIKKNK